MGEVKPCSRTRCFVHDGETCADGYMRHEDCPRWRDPRPPTKPQPYARAQVDEIRASIDPTGPLAGEGETVRRLLLTLAERDQEIARLKAALDDSRAAFRREAAMRADDIGRFSEQNRELREELRLALVANEDQRTAILAERERCAKIAEGPGPVASYIGQRIAAEIRGDQEAIKRLNEHALAMLRPLP